MSESFVSISGEFARTARIDSQFESLKTGHKGKDEISGRSYEITRGIPADAKLLQVIYVYESPSVKEPNSPWNGGISETVAVTFSSE